MLPIVYAANTLLYQLQGAIPFATSGSPGESTSKSTLSAGLNGCEGVTATKGLGGGVQANAVNFFDFWSPIVAIVLIVVAAFASIGSNGGRAWRKVVVIIAVILLLPSAITLVHSLTTSSKC